MNSPWPATAVPADAHPARRGPRRPQRYRRHPAREGRTGAVFPLGADGAALAAFLQGVAQGTYRPEVLTASPANIFADRDVTAIALQLPYAALGGTQVAAWARLSLVGHAPQQQVSRISQAMLRPLFFTPLDADFETLNAEHLQRPGSPRRSRRPHRQDHSPPGRTTRS